MSLLLVVADSLRADVLGCCGGPVATPTLDRLAAESTLFPRAVTAAPWTVPSLAALFTGCHPHRLGLARWDQPWPAHRPTLFRRAEAAGLEPASFVFDPRYLFAAVPEAHVCGSSQHPERVLQWLQARRGRPFFAFVHHWWTHVPYLDAPMDTRGWRTLTDQVLAALRAGPAARDGVKRFYRRAVERFSEVWLPPLLDAVDLDRTWIVVTADHGESWGERPGAAVRDVFDLHGNVLSEEVLRVPLLIRPPGGGPARRPAGLARTVDLAPTLAELLDLGGTPADDADGCSLAGCVREGAAAPAPHALSVRSGDFVNAPSLPEAPAELWTGYALTTPRHKLVWEPGTGTRRAYDLPADPDETTDVAERDGALLAAHWKTLEAEQDLAVVGSAGEADRERLAERLRALGYID